MSRRRVGGAIKKGRGAKIVLREEEVDEDVEDTKKAKEPVKTQPIAKKGGKAAVQQEQILLDIENENTTRHIKELCVKFEPPACIQCPNRNADRVCVCEACGNQDYLSLICGKCHITKHTAAKEKPELDIEEFFMKLGTFLNETKKDPNFSQQGIDVEKLQGAFAKIAEFEYKLGEIEENFRKEIATYKSPEEIEGTLAGSVAKALSEPTYVNIQEQLADIKGLVLFDNNDFKWNSIQDKAKLLRNQVKIIKEESKEIRYTINSSFVGGKEIDLSEIELKIGLGQQNNNKAPKIYLSKQNCITIQTMARSYQGQYYLDYEIYPNKKYILKFTITSYNGFYFFVGLMRKDQIGLQFMYSGTNGFFFKRFANSNPAQDCSKVLQGNLFGDIVKSGDSFEMRFCIEDQTLEFSTLPDHDNVVSKVDHAIFDTSPDVQYVITLNTCSKLGVSFDSLDESFFLSSYC